MGTVKSDALCDGAKRNDSLGDPQKRGAGINKLNGDRTVAADDDRFRAKSAPLLLPRRWRCYRGRLADVRELNLPAVERQFMLEHDIQR